MILISSEVNDFSTNDVIDWFIFKSIPFSRVNKEDDCVIKFNEKNILIIVNNETTVDTSLLKSFWYRRGMIKIKSRNIKNINLLVDYSVQEEEILNQYLNNKLGCKKLNSFYTTYPNKLLVNQFASEIGINVPKTHILDNKKDIVNVLKQYPLITKGVTQSSTFKNYNTYECYMSYTNRVTEEILEKIPDIFFPSLFQEEIKKAYELRIFFLNDKFWSMAIFSQKDIKTEVDFRRYNSNNPNRTVPYKLKNRIEQKLYKLMRKLNLNSGSIDMLVEKESNKLYFLEVNPIGQFAMTSYPCNYNIEEEISKFLSNE